MVILSECEGSGGLTSDNPSQSYRSGRGLTAYRPPVRLSARPSVLELRWRIGAPVEADRIGIDLLDLPFAPGRGARIAQL